MPKTLLPPPAASFVERKSRIVQQLAVPDADYADASPKGTVDVGIRDFVDEINAVEGFVTTSSCAGRVSVFLEGRKATAADGDQDERQQVAGVGGKGGGGTWLFVSHEPLPHGADGGPRQGNGQGQDWATVFGLGELETAPSQGADGDNASKQRRLVHFKFEPMILHVLTTSPAHAQLLVRCALQAGFRESGAVGLTSAAAGEPATPIVAVRSMGLGLESLIGYEQDGRRRLMVSRDYLDTLVSISAERFSENTKRIERFRTAFRDAMQGGQPKKNPSGGEWEDAAARRERLRAEGLKRREALKNEAAAEKTPVSVDSHNDDKAEGAGDLGMLDNL